MERIKQYFSQPRGQVIFGIDGYIDEVWQIIETRESVQKYTLRETMKSFGELIMHCGEGGVSNEIIRKRRTYGGFCANTGKAAASMGAKTTLLGMFGKNSIEPAFQPIQEVANLVSLSDPAVSHIFEFVDGKIMLPYIQEVTGFNWESLVSALPQSQLKELYQNADIVALGYWSLMPAFDEIITGLCENFLPADGSQRMFFDFADIRKRDRVYLEQTLDLLNRLSKQYNLPMMLSLNEHEAALLFSYYGQVFDEAKPQASTQGLAALRAKLGLQELIVHTPRFAAAASADEGAVMVPQRYCERPVITTGAGDNFNGGYIAASFCNLNLEERLMVGNAATGFYVQNGRSATVADLLCELRLLLSVSP